MQFEIQRNPENPGTCIYFYGGFREKNHNGGGGGGVQFEILKKSGINFYSGFRKTSQGGGGGGANLIPKKVAPP